MTNQWLSFLTINPIPALLDWPDTALSYYVQRDLLENPVKPVETLWNLPEITRLVSKQLENGSWKYPGKTIAAETGQNYFLLETYRNLRILVEIGGLTRAHPAIQKAAEYVFSCQTSQGDIRGILGNQAMPYYHGALLELFIKAGYEQDPRVLAGLEYLLRVRQEDGGWIVPAQAVPPNQRTAQFWTGQPVELQRWRPHAHLATGMVLRAFAAHPDYQQRPEILAAGQALKHRFFQADSYNDRKDPAYWLKFQFPFWWPNLLTALDSLAKLGFDSRDADISCGLAWFSDHQAKDGLWPTGYDKGAQAEANRHWFGLAVCRMLRLLTTC